MEFAHKFKGKYSLKFRRKNGIGADCKISIIPVKLVCRPNDEVNLLVCYGFGKEPMLPDNKVNYAGNTVVFSRDLLPLQGKLLCETNVDSSPHCLCVGE